MNQMFMGIMLVLGLATFYLYNQNQTLTANNLALEGAVQEQQMAKQFEYDMKLKEAELGNHKAKEKEIEDRKDNRTKLQATQQSKMIDQRKNNSLPIDFEDDSGLNLEQFM